VAAVLVILSLALYWPPAQTLFHFGPLHLDDLSACLASGAVLIGLLEIGKRGMRVNA
jgi:Ca2+-transporting ATPase